MIGLQKDGNSSVEVTIKKDDVTSAAAGVACELAASWIDDDDVQASEIGSSRPSRPDPQAR